MQKVLIASDHAGYKLKEKIKKSLSSEYDFVDLGTENENSVDYPIYAEKLAQQISINSGYFGILICGSGIGMSIASNKVNGVRTALAYTIESAELSRKHNNANILALAGRLESKDNKIDIVRTFLETEFSNEKRHIKRIEEIREIEKNN